MRLSLRAFAAAAVLASTTGLLAASSAPASASCSPIGWEDHTVYNGPFGWIHVPVPNEVRPFGCPTV